MEMLVQIVENANVRFWPKAGIQSTATMSEQIKLHSLF